MANPISLILSDVEADNPLVPPLPNLTEELVFAFFRQNAGVSINRSYGNGGALANIGSGPVYSDNYGTFTPYTNAVMTPVFANYVGMTFMAIIRPILSGGTGAFNRIFACDPITLPTPAFNVLTAGAQLQLSGTSPVTGTATLDIADTSRFHFVAGTIGGADTTLINNYTEGTESVDGPSGASLLLNPSSQITIGSAVAGGPTRTSQFVWSAIVARRLTSDERLAYYNSMKVMAEFMSDGTILI